VTRAPAASYALLPQSAGFAQLLEQGSVKVTKWVNVIHLGNMSFNSGGGGDATVISPRVPHRITEQAQEFLILRKIRLPGGLAGWHSLEFVLAPGVPEPDGLPKGAKVRRE
jgi:hypothetical protein